MLSPRYFRSRATPSDDGVGLSQNSFGGDLVARTVLHEFGHQFGKLEDEYTQTKSSSSSLGFDLSVLDSSKKFIYIRNCALPEDVQERWSSVPGWDGSTFVGCGGDCNDVGCTTFVRPTFNSVMRNQRLYCSAPSEDSCTKGPRKEDPAYDGFGPVNSFYLLKELDKYDNSPPEASSTVEQAIPSSETTTAVTTDGAVSPPEESSTVVAQDTSTTSETSPITNVQDVASLIYSAGTK